MKVICCRCRVHLRDLPSDVFTDDAVSHGLCETCAHHFLAQGGMSLSEYLEGIPFPILTVTAEGNINSANSKALNLIGKCPSDIQGFAGGDVFECEYAKLSEGCGKTIHCSGCTIRNTVMDTVRTGRPNRRIPAFLQRTSDLMSERVELLISTEKKFGIVFLQIDEVAPTEPLMPTE